MSVTILLAPKMGTSIKLKTFIEQADTVMSQNGTDPHVSLAVFDSVNVGDVANVIAAADFGCDEVILEFPSIGFFKGDPTAVILQPIPTTQLIEIHRRLFIALGELSTRSWSYYKPGAWAPHMTLGSRVQVDRALQISRKANEAGVCGRYAFDRIEVVESPPWRIRHSIHFKESPNQSTHLTPLFGASSAEQEPHAP
jgi:2'-5' RNA ligase